MLRYDEQRHCYTGGGLRVAPRVLCERVAGLVVAGERPGRAFERLLDESAWLGAAGPTPAEAGVGPQGATVRIALALPSGAVSLLARAIASGPGWLDLVPAVIPGGLSAAANGALARLTMPNGRTVVGQLLAVSAGGELRVSVPETAANRGTEHRLHLRFLPLEPVQALALVRTDGGGATVRVGVIDLSRQGVGLLAARPLPTGTPLTLQVQASDRSDALIAGARVVWSSALADGWRIGAAIRSQMGG